MKCKFINKDREEVHTIVEHGSEEWTSWVLGQK